MKDFGQQLGDPDIKLAGLSIWIHQREVPEATDYWDGNWVLATASCEASGALVWTDGPIIHLPEIERLMNGVQQMYTSLSGIAVLGCMEPELDFQLNMTGQGRIEMEVNITADHLAQEHCFRFELDQSYLPKLVDDCAKVLAKYPVKHDSSETN